MINLTRLSLGSPRYTPFEKIRLAIETDFYVAENMADYKNEAPKIINPWYKQLNYFPFSGELFDRAAIILNNVRLEVCGKDPDDKGPDWFRVSDSTGEDRMYWSVHDMYFSAAHSFEELYERQGLKDGDWVHEVLVLYWIKKELPIICNVQKYPTNGGRRNKETLADRVRELLLTVQPGFQNSS
ncbi:TPA: hypothetical protein HA265_03085 [Candidatus Woesearchaeota archaeon]|nr:hypothetical protein [Candidatus Woesearchaeota archaeon]